MNSRAIRKRKNLKIKNYTITKEVKYKNLALFFVASSSLIISGYVIGESKEDLQLLLSLWCNITGVFLVYRLNDSIDQNQHFKLNLKNFLASSLHRVILIQFLFVLIPLSVIYLQPFVLLILTGSAVLGIAYSINFKVGNRQFRLKNVFFVKNLLIGVTWGSLTLIGSSSNPHSSLIALFIFASIQVFLGGMIRDIPDLQKDKINNVNSFPVVFGVRKTLYFMHFVNLITGAYFLISTGISVGALIYVVPTAWRAMNIYLVGKNPMNRNWSQAINLLTCVFILLMLLILKFYAGISN